MKKSLPSFFAGVATTLLIGALSVSALAITGHMTLEVDPINIQVNGEVFQPKDAAGNDVPVFVYQGTTYAPLRALAEAYGLEVGYDKDRNLAYVIDPDVIGQGVENAPGVDDNFFAQNGEWSEEEDAEYQIFKDMWDVRLTDKNKGIVNLDYNKDSVNELGEFISDKTMEETYKYAKRLGIEVCEENDCYNAIYKYETKNDIAWLWSTLYTNNKWLIGCGDSGYNHIMQMWRESQ